MVKWIWCSTFRKVNTPEEIWKFEKYPKMKDVFKPQCKREDRGEGVGGRTTLGWRSGQFQLNCHIKESQIVGENRSKPLGSTHWSLLWSQKCLNVSIKPELKSKVFQFIIPLSVFLYLSPNVPRPHWGLTEKIRIEKCSSRVAIKRKGRKSLKQTRGTIFYLMLFSSCEGVQRHRDFCADCWRHVCMLRVCIYGQPRNRDTLIFFKEISFLSAYSDLLRLTHMFLCLLLSVFPSVSGPRDRDNLTVTLQQ